MIAIATPPPLPPLNRLQSEVLAACRALMKRDVHPTPNSVAFDMGRESAAGLAEAMGSLIDGGHLVLTTKPSHAAGYHQPKPAKPPAKAYHDAAPPLSECLKIARQINEWAGDAVAAVVVSRGDACSWARSTAVQSDAVEQIATIQVEPEVAVSPEVNGAPESSEQPANANCVVCNTPFWSLRGTTVCGLECKQERHRKVDRKHYAANPERRRKKNRQCGPANCIMCGAEFQRDRNSKTCGPDCSRSLQRKCDREKIRRYREAKKEVA